METSEKSNEKPGPSAGPQTSAPNNHKPPFWTKPLVILIGTVAIAGLLFIGLDYLARSVTHESTDNAFLDGDVVSIAPKISGHVKKVSVVQNQPVKAGDPLVEIDPRDYEVQLTQQKAALAAADANTEVIKASFAMLETQVLSAKATAQHSEADVASDRAKADKADADLKRAEDLFQKNIISPQEFDTAKAAAISANATVKSSEEQAASDRAKVATAEAQLQAGRKALDRAAAQTEQSKADVDQADLNLSYTKIVAPQDGRIARKAVEAGDYVQTGQRLMALVLNRLWVTANFKETQLTRIRVGQPVEISIDSIAGRTFRGHVESIQAGSGAVFSLLPPENAVGNFVKVVQRVPVRILFDQPLETAHTIGPGMSVMPSVRVRGFEFPAVVIALFAILFALVAGWFWRKAAVRKTSQL